MSDKERALASVQSILTSVQAIQKGLDRDDTRIDLTDLRRELSVIDSMLDSAAYEFDCD